MPVFEAYKAKRVRMLCFEVQGIHTEGRETFHFELDSDRPFRPRTQNFSVAASSPAPAAINGLWVANDELKIWELSP